MSQKLDADLGVKMEINSGVIKGRFYVTTPLSDIWEAFTPPQAGSFYTSSVFLVLRTSIECIIAICMGRFYTR